MLIHHCAERGCSLTEADIKKKKCPTCGHPMNVISEEVADPPPPPPPPPAPPEPPVN